GPTWFPIPFVTSVRFADLDRDGHVDLVAGLANVTNVGTVFWGRGGASFGDATALGMRRWNPLPGGTIATLAHDLNSDGYPDIAFVEPSSSRVPIYRNLRNRTFKEDAVLDFYDKAGAADPVAADFNGDGATDLAVAAENYGIQFFLGH